MCIRDRSAAPARAQERNLLLHQRLEDVDEGDFAVQPVSYTHLDVYKRQTPNRALPAEAGSGMREQ